MVVIDDHDMLDTGEASIPRDVIETGEGLIFRDVLDVGEGSIPKDLQDLNIKSTEVQEQIDLPEDEKPNLGDIFDTIDDGYNMYKVYSEKGKFNIRKSEADVNDEDKDGNTKRKRKTLSRVTNCPTLAHQLKVALMGGYDKVRGTPGDYRNFDRVVNLFIGDRDAHMIVDKMINQQLHVPEFSFEHHVLHDELVSMFWADDTMKCNYAVFCDVVSFDATFMTNK
uniref:Protein FAR1-related sequence 5-like n=1 Tax=Tanacetum cinerariifolium TaxID=118510 RepID=A0A699ILL5_TANCI|nr:protein FAR1-related sequence 5-like [Tanacetum cinerariifolium]